MREQIFHENVINKSGNQEKAKITKAKICSWLLVVNGGYFHQEKLNEYFPPVALISMVWEEE